MEDRNQNGNESASSASGGSRNTAADQKPSSSAGEKLAPLRAEAITFAIGDGNTPLFRNVLGAIFSKNSSANIALLLAIGGFFYVHLLVAKLDPGFTGIAQLFDFADYVAIVVSKHYLLVPLYLLAFMVIGYFIFFLKTIRTVFKSDKRRKRVAERGRKCVGQVKSIGERRYGAMQQLWKRGRERVLWMRMMQIREDRKTSIDKFKNSTEDIELLKRIKRRAAMRLAMLWTAYALWLAVLVLVSAAISVVYQLLLLVQLACLKVGFALAWVTGIGV